MALPLYMDVHVPRVITVGFRARGLDVLTAQEDGTAELEDSQLLDRASDLRRLLFSRDDDLLREATARRNRHQAFASLVYAHQLRVSIGQCINDLEVLAKAGTGADVVGHVFFLPL